ncbi:MAG TPA: hypothetical protein VLI69_04925 [Gammaproteobacteria bacterium]|nr:hypothetical protein [Gammaproteobacteria bacterium]
MFNRMQPSESEFKHIEDIKQQGKLLGNGKYGYAYLIGDRVYKIYSRPIFAFQPYYCAEVSARYWNKTYEQIHQGKYKDYATAHYINLTSKENHKNYEVLVTPFIEGKQMPLRCLWIPPIGSLIKFKKALHALSLQMEDDLVPGNIRVSSRGDFLPIDFDNVYSLPAKKGLFFKEYNCPSPRTRHHKKNNFFVTITDKPVESTEQELKLLQSNSSTVSI